MSAKNTTTCDVNELIDNFANDEAKPFSEISTPEESADADTTWIQSKFYFIMLTKNYNEWICDW